MANGGGNTTQSQTSGRERQSLFGGRIPFSALAAGGAAAAGLALKTGHDILTTMAAEKLLRFGEKRKQSLLQMRGTASSRKGPVPKASASYLSSQGRPKRQPLSGRGGGGFNPGQPRDPQGRWD